jgi:hypothetical protein
MEIPKIRLVTIAPRIILLTLLSGFVFISCNNVADEKKTLEFAQFTIEVPSTWGKVKLRGIDSFVGLIAIDETDTLSFDLGWYSNSLEESQCIIYETDEGNQVHVLNEDRSTPGYPVYEFVGMTTEVDINTFMKDTAMYSVIDNRKAKIVKPKKSGAGTTGVYFDSLWVAGSGIDRFQINGRNLKPDNERLVLEAIQTLRFRRK